MSVKDLIKKSVLELDMFKNSFTPEKILQMVIALGAVSYTHLAHPGADRNRSAAAVRALRHQLSGVPCGNGIFIHGLCQTEQGGQA